MKEFHSPLIVPLIGIATLFAPQAPSATPPHPGADTAQALTRAAQAELAKLGVKLDELPPLRTLKSAELVALCAAELDATAPAGWFEARHRLRDAFALTSPDSPKALRERLARQAAASSAVRYDRASGTLVFDVERALEPTQFEGDVLRQLVLVAREKQLPLAEALGERASSEAWALQHALRMGEAEFVARAVRGSGAGAAPASSAWGAADSTALLPILCREHGLTFMEARAASAGGLGALAGAYAEPPQSTEQLLHAEKLFRDRPRSVSLPEWSEKSDVESVVYDDELGELGLLAVLLEAGVEPARARIAALGWDGDRMLVLRNRAGATAQVWRLYFDRPEDVRQFSELWRMKAAGALVARAVTCDWVRADSIAFAAALAEDLAAAPPRLQPAPEDQESTALAEAALQARRADAPRLEGGLWSVPALDFSMHVPESWTLETFDGVPHLLAPQVESYRDNISVAEVDSSVDEGIEQLLERQTRVITLQTNLKLVLAETRVVDGRQAVYLRYSGEMGAQKLEFAALMFVRNKRVVAVTTSASAQTWPQIESLIDAAYRSIRVGVAGAPR